MKKKTILLTGSTGFIGRNLLEKLEKKYNICAPGHKELDLLNQQDVSDYLRKQRFDIVIHTANTNNIVKPDVSAYDCLDGNLRMFFNLEKCKDHYGKMYYFGSGAEYDMLHYCPDMKEDYFGIYIPRDFYGFSKYIMSRMCDQCENIYDFRLFGVFGKYEEYGRRFISNAICRGLAGMDITIHKNVYFDYIHVDDLADIMEFFLENEPKYKHYNICRGEKIDLYSLAVMVRDILKLDCDIIVEEEGLKPEYTGSNRRMLEELAAFEFRGFEYAIAELCEWYKCHWNEIDINKL